MKRILAVLLAATFVLGAVAQASAADVKVKGTFDFAFGWRDGYISDGDDDSGFITDKDANADDFMSRQRVRTQVEFIASETLKGVLMFEIGNTNWGRKANADGKVEGGNLDTDGINIETKHAYIDWYVPGTGNAAVENALRIKMGLQPLALPSATFGNPVFNADVAAIVASYQFNNEIAMTAFWARPYDEKETISSGNTYDAMDLFGVVVPMNFESFTVAPWLVYGSIGGVSTYGKELGATESSLYIGGFAATTKIADFEFGLDAMYGWTDKDGSAGYETRGWLAAMKVDYVGFEWGTPGAFGWYASGDDYDDYKDDNKFGMLPVVGTDNGFTPTSFGFPGSAGIGDDTAVNGTGLGTWGVGIQLADLSFVEDLSHTLRFAYYQGTNDDQMVRQGITTSTTKTYGQNVGVVDEYLTTGDSAYEINLDSTYKIYENLDMIVELAYIHMDWDTSSKMKAARGDLNDDAFKGQILFQYKF